MTFLSAWTMRPSGAPSPREGLAALNHTEVGSGVAKSGRKKLCVARNHPSKGRARSLVYDRINIITFLRLFSACCPLASYRTTHKNQATESRGAGDQSLSGPSTSCAFGLDGGTQCVRSNTAQFFAQIALHIHTCPKPPSAAPTPWEGLAALIHTKVGSGVAKSGRKKLCVARNHPRKGRA